MSLKVPNGKGLQSYVAESNSNKVQFGRATKDLRTALFSGPIAC